jgi:glucose/arabinose dehydrogenase
MSHSPLTGAWPSDSARIRARSRNFAVAWVAAWLPIVCIRIALNLAEAADEQPFGIDHRILWTTSRVTGSPDPPLPYTVEKTFTNINWKAPIFVIPEPDTDWLLVVQQGGEKEKPSKILRLRDDPDADRVETFLEVSNRLVYSVVFHPGYRTNGYLFMFSNGTTSETERTNRISRFTVGRQPPHPCDPKTEQVILEWHSQGHDGGGIVFGHDGMLYVSTGDGTSDSDGWVSGQDLSELLGGVLRIDVEHPDPSRSYSVPRDNPFVGRTNARPEIWAYGLRNPWRMATDQKTGQIWVGNNGQDLWETAHLIRRGENYGWSVYEGNHPFYLNRKLGPTPVVPPTIEHHHAEARSLTGGVVYYGDKLSELNGAYIYGDYSSGKIWGARHDGSTITWHQELADTQIQITAFAVNHHGELLIADHAGGFHRLVPAPRQTPTAKFPTRLSETGLFLSTKTHQVQPGLIPYSVNAPGWTDGAYVQRFIALPDDSRIDFTSSGGWNFTNGAVLVQTLSLEHEVGNPASRQRLETRLLTRPNNQWVGYSYRWDENQSDAVLVPKNGGQSEFEIQDRRAPNGIRRQVWHYPSRAECLACHSRAVNFVLGLTELQMNKLHDYGGVPDNQLRTLEHIGILN